jgi:hypothetical protein
MIIATVENIINNPMLIRISHLFLEPKRAPRTADGIEDIAKEIAPSKTSDVDTEPIVKYTKIPGAINAVGRNSDFNAIDTK